MGVDVYSGVSEVGVCRGISGGCLVVYSGVSAVGVCSVWSVVVIQCSQWGCVYKDQWCVNAGVSGGVCTVLSEGVSGVYWGSWPW